MAFILLFYCLMTFLSSERKSATLEPSHESLHLLQNCFELLRTSASHCKCTEGIPCQRCQNGLKILSGKHSRTPNVFFPVRMTPHFGGLKLCCFRKQSKIYFFKKEICPVIFWFVLVLFYFIFFLLAFGHCQMWNAMGF